MPSKNMLPKGKRRHTVKHEYRAHRTLVNEREAAAREAGELAEPAAAAGAFDTAGWAADPAATGCDARARGHPARGRV